MSFRAAREMGSRASSGLVRSTITAKKPNPSPPNFAPPSTQNPERERLNPLLRHQRPQLLRGQLPPLPDLQFPDPDRTDGRPHQLQHLAPHRLDHSPHLPVPPFRDRDL